MKVYLRGQHVGHFGLIMRWPVIPHCGVCGNSTSLMYGLWDLEDKPMSAICQTCLDKHLCSVGFWQLPAQCFPVPS